MKTCQDRRSKRAVLEVEPLEGRKLLSTTSTMAAPLSGALVSGISYLDLQGSAHGTTSIVAGNPDVGTTVLLKGSGVVTGLGSVKISGSLHGTGFIANSHVEGSIKLSNGKGIFNLQLQSPAKGGFTAPTSGSYTFASTGGSGAFKKDFGHGSIILILRSHSFTMNFQGKPNVY